MQKRDQVDPVTALSKVADILALDIAADTAVAVPEEPLEHYVIEGTTGAHQDPKARLVYFQTPEGTLTLTWRVETDMLGNWLLSYIDAVNANQVFGVVDYVTDASYTV